MVKKQVIPEIVKLWEKLSPQLTEAIKGERVWLDYDREVDRLYISFEKPQSDTDNEMLDNDMLDNDIIVSYRDGEIIGLTVWMHLPGKVDEAPLCVKLAKPVTGKGILGRVGHL